MSKGRRTNPNLQIRRLAAVTTAAGGLCLLGLAGLGPAALGPSSVAHGATTPTTLDGAINRRLQQLADVASSLASHIKDPDLLDGDNPGW